MPPPAVLWSPPADVLSTTRVGAYLSWLERDRGSTFGDYDALLRFLDRAVADRLVTPAHRAMLAVETEPAALLDRFAEYTPPRVEKWIDREET